MGSKTSRTVLSALATVLLVPLSTIGGVAGCGR